MFEKQINFILRNDFAFKFLAAILSLSNQILLQEWSDYLLQMTVRSDLFVTFLIHNDLFHVFLAFLHRNLWADWAIDSSFPLHQSDLTKHKFTPPQTISQIFYVRLFGNMPNSSPFDIDRDIFNKLMLNLIGKRDTSKNMSPQKLVNEGKSKVIVDRDRLPIAALELMEVQKFSDVFMKNLEKLGKSNTMLKVRKFGNIYPSLCLLIKFLSFTFLKNRKRAFFKNYLSNELLTPELITIMEHVSQLSINFSQDLEFFENYYWTENPFDYLEKINFLNKFIYSVCQIDSKEKMTISYSFKKIYDLFFADLSKKVKASNQNEMKSKSIRLKIYEEQEYPFGDVSQLTFKHNCPYSKIEQKISDIFDHMYYFSIIYVNFDENQINISQSEENFRQIISTLDSMHTHYDEDLEVKLLIKEEMVNMISINCSGCGNSFNVENTLENRTMHLLCANCQNSVVNNFVSKKRFPAPFYK